jgi:hypothetical protein
MPRALLQRFAQKADERCGQLPAVARSRAALNKTTAGQTETKQRPERHKQL